MGKTVSSFSEALQAEAQAGNECAKKSNEKESNTVCNGVPYGCEECSDNSKNMSRTNNYFRRIKSLVSACCITDTNKIILCSEIVEEKEKSIFSDTSIEEEKKYLKELTPSDLYEADCVQILDAIPLDRDEFEESEIEYYDSLINL